MKFIAALLTLLIQVIGGYCLEFGIYVVGIGGGWEMIALPLVCTLVVCMVGWWRSVESQNSGQRALTFLLTLLGAGIGIGLIMQIGAVGFFGLFIIPLLGALFGYYFAQSAV